MKKVPIDYEVIEERDQYSKVFRKIDGTYEVSVYNEPIHYYEDSEWKDIDNRLDYDEGNNEYENKKNGYKIKLPQTINENKQFKLKVDDYKLDWRILGISKSEIEVENQDKTSTNLRVLEHVNQRVLYPNVFADVDLEYILKGNQIKENFILNNFKDDFKVNIELSVKGLTLVEEGNQYYFVDQNQHVILDLNSFYMFDHNKDLSDDIEVLLQETKKDQYLLTLVPNQDWLENASYPVTIDPPITIKNEGTVEPIKDGYINKGVGYENDTYIKVGRTYHGYIEFNLDSLKDLSIVTYANLY
jgi:hypothetical protein